jgi:hypothetical protein
MSEPIFTLCYERHPDWGEQRVIFTTEYLPLGHMIRVTEIDKEYLYTVMDSESVPIALYQFRGESHMGIRPAIIYQYHLGHRRTT